MCSRRPRGDRRKAGAILLAILLASGTASAETFRYVDRQGHSHTMEVSEDAATPSPPAAPSPPAVDDQASAVPMGELPYLAYAKRASETYLVPLELVLAVMKVESGFNPHAISNKGALGLMQLMPTTAADLGVVDPFDPAQNIDGGVRYLHTLLDGFSGDVEPALAAYHAGAERVRRAGGVAPFEVTRRYVATVLRLSKTYAAAGAGGQAGSAPETRPLPASTRSRVRGAVRESAPSRRLHWSL